MPSATRLITKRHPYFIGIHLGAISIVFCAKIIESTNIYLCPRPFGVVSTIELIRIILFVVFIIWAMYAYTLGIIYSGS